MKYSLRNQEKIAAKFGETYLRDVIIASLDQFFTTSTDEEIGEVIENSTMFPSEWADKCTLLPVNDVSDKKGDDCQLFAVIGKETDVIKLAYIEVFRG